MAPAASKEEEELVSTTDERTKKIEEALNVLGSCRSRCSEMLKAACEQHLTGDLELRCLDILEKDMSYIVVSLAALSPQHVDEEMMAWLQELNGAMLITLPRALDEAEPQRHTWLRRTAQCFRHRHRYPYRLRSAAEEIYRLAQYPSSRHLLTGIPSVGLPPTQAPKIGGLLPVGTDLSGFPCEIMEQQFEKDRLVMKWLCEAGLPASDPDWAGKAENFFFHLVDQGVITYASVNSRRINLDQADAWKWNLNHLQHQFLASKSAEVGLVSTSDTLNSAAASATDHGNGTGMVQQRKLALHHDGPNIPSLLQKLDLLCTRSLTVSGAVSGVPTDKFVNLVVLDFEGWENLEDEDLLQICRSKMYFLKYLSIRNTRVRKLPPVISELCSLDILDASCTHITELPLEVFMATTLGRLDLRGTLISQLKLPKQIMGLRDSLRGLLLGSEGLVNSSQTIATRVPHDIRHFCNLETLATIDLREQPASFVKALGDLHNLRVLAITWSFHQSSDMDCCEALRSSIIRWSKLRSLTIHCGLGCSMEFLGSLSYMPLYLETFKVTLGRFAGVPRWFSGTAWLSFLQITVWKLGAHDLEILRSLPALRCLILGLDFIPRQDILIKTEGFYQLQRFSIDCPVPWLTFESGAMPKLTYLQLDFRPCPTSPMSMSMGLSNLRSLTKVALWCNIRYANSSSIKMIMEAVRKEVAKCHNTTQMVNLFINDIKQDDVEADDEETQNSTGTPSGTNNPGSEVVVQVVDEITEAEC